MVSIDSILSTHAGDKHEIKIVQQLPVKLIFTIIEAVQHSLDIRKSIE